MGRTIALANVGFTDSGRTVYTIDPTVFVDDDGQACLHYGGFSRLVVAKRNDAKACAP